MKSHKGSRSYRKSAPPYGEMPKPPIAVGEWREPENMSRIKIPRREYNRLKALAEKHGTTIEALVEKALNWWIANETKREKQAKCKT